MQGEVFKIKTESVFNRDPFLKIIVKKPDSALSWATSVIDHAELREKALLLCNHLVLSEETKTNWSHLDRLRLAFLERGVYEPSSEWLKEGERGYQAILSAINRFYDHGMPPQIAVNFVKKAVQNEGFKAWIIQLSTKEQNHILHQIGKSSELASEMQVLFLETKSPEVALKILQDNLKDKNLSIEAIRTLTKTISKEEALAGQWFTELFFKRPEDKKYKDAPTAAMIEILADCEWGKNAPFITKKGWALVSKCWDEMAQSRFQTGIAYAKWVNKLGEAGRWAADEIPLPGGSRKKTTRKISPVRNNQTWYQKVSEVGNGNPVTIALILQHEKTVQQLLDLGWHLPSAGAIKNLAKTINQDLHRMKSAKGFGEDDLRISRSYDEEYRQDLPEPLHFGDSFLALAEKFQLQKTLTRDQKKQSSPQGDPEDQGSSIADTPPNRPKPKRSL